MGSAGGGGGRGKEKYLCIAAAASGMSGVRSGVAAAMMTTRNVRTGEGVEEGSEQHTSLAAAEAISV